MQSSTEHQLSLITRKTQALEEQLTAQIDAVRHMQAERDASAAEAAELRARLDAAEKRAQHAAQQHQEGSLQLKHLAAEFSKAQLLQKRYRNAVSEQNGYCKSFLVVRAADDAGAGRVSYPNAFVLADECTVNLPGRWQRSVSIDGALCVPLTQQQQQLYPSAIAADSVIPPCIDVAIGDVIAGINASVICFGPPGQLKNHFMFGDQPNHPAGTGLVQRSIRRLFASLEGHRVTHFSMRMSMGEITAPDDQFRDLLSEYSNVLTLGRSPDVRCIPVQGEAEALGLVQLGMQRAVERDSMIHMKNNNGGSGTGQNPTSPQQLTHKFVVLTVENFDSRGHFRKGTFLFVDVAPALVLGGRAALHHQQQPAGGEYLWAQQSTARFCDTIAFLAAGNGGGGISNNRPAWMEHPSGLMLLLGESLGGNSKTSLVACLDAAAIVDPETQDASDVTVGTLNTALMIKSVKNSVMAFDVPAELQRLNMETENFTSQ